MKNNQIKKFKKRLNAIIEEEIDTRFYQTALEEIESENKVKGLWAKSLSEAEGDFKRAESTYLKLRAKSLQDSSFSTSTKDFETDNHDQLQNSLTKASTFVGKIIGFYLLLSCLGLVITALLFFTGDEDSALVSIFYSILFAVPFLIIKVFFQNPSDTFLESKKRVTKIYLITFLVSLFAYVLGWILGFLLIVNWIRMNRSFKNYPV